MKKITVILCLLMALIFAFAGCVGGNTGGEEEYMEYGDDRQEFSEEEIYEEETDIADVVPTDAENGEESTAAITTAKNTTAVPTTQEVEESETAALSVRDIYKKYVNGHRGELKDSEYDFYFYDIDDDGTDECFAITKTEFESYSRLKYLYIFDYSDGVVEKIGGEYNIGNSRCCSRVILSEYNGQYYIMEAEDDGSHYNLKTLYTYDGSQFIAHESIYKIDYQWSGDRQWHYLHSTVHDFLRGTDIPAYEQYPEEEISEEEYNGLVSEFTSYGTVLVNFNALVSNYNG